MTRPARPAYARLLLPALPVLLGGMLSVLATDAAAAATPTVEEPHACVQALIATDADGRVDLVAMPHPRYRVAARLSGQDCAGLPGQEVDAAELSSLLQALRSLGARLEQGAEPALAACRAQGGPIQFSSRAPRADGATMRFSLLACGEEMAVTAHQTGKDTALALQVGDASPGPQARMETAPSPWTRWRPDQLHVDATLTRDSTGDSRDDKAKLRFDGTWQRGADDIRLELHGEFARIGQQSWRREYFGRLGWIHDFDNRWFTLVEGRAERDRVRLLGQNFDYLLLQGSAGGGYQWRWNRHGSLRAAVLWNEFTVDLIGTGIDIGVGVPSAYLAGEWKITPRWDASASLRYYRWGDGDTGAESEAELAYALSRHLGFGFRWRYSHSAATLSRGDEVESELFLRYKF
ncbi:DUF481 domain-containing protein [Arenimonas sp. MALMAid1274]|uniref:DUF481 domain-containing protein n=1 Tax=Arenimonas sp. MALMAid1274 TaxID=3411630 RepID=UPI003BA0615E